MGSKIKLLLFFCFCWAGLNSVQAENDSNQTAAQQFVAPVFVKRHAFVDSLLTDSLYSVLKQKMHPTLNNAALPKVVDKFSPFEHPAFRRYSIGKFWFFLISVIIVIVFVYYRNIFAKQFLNRVRGLYSRYYFNELISDTGTTLNNGSIWAVVLFVMIFGQFSVVCLSYLKYIKLANNINFYILIIIFISIWKILLLVIQRLQSCVLDGTEVLKSQWQRQISVDLVVFLILFPFLNFVYFNSSKIAVLDIGKICFGMFAGWLLIRTIWALWGMIGDRSINFKFILYFCTFEILPHGILLSALYRAYI